MSTDKQENQPEQAETQTPIPESVLDPIQQKDLQIAELTNICKRVQAEFDNYRKRMQDERKEWNNQAKAQVIQSLLPTLDAFELSLKHVNGNDLTSLQQTLMGMQFIFSNLQQTLASQGVVAIPTQGVPFDAYKHEPIETVPATKEHRDGTIISTKQQGYMIGDKVLRHAKVVVAKTEDKSDRQ